MKILWSNYALLLKARDKECKEKFNEMRKIFWYKEMYSKFAFSHDQKHVTY